MAFDKNKITAEAARHVQKGQLDKAIRAYEKIVEADPGDVRALLKIGELQQKKGEIAAAAETFGRVADAYSTQGFFLKSVAVYKQMLKLAPDDVRVSERLAQLYQQLGLVSETMAQLQLIARWAERAGDDTKLVDSLRRIVELDPDDVATSVRLGDVYARLSSIDLAVEHLRRAAAGLKRNSRLDEYTRVLERIAALIPEDRDLARETASLLLARGEAKRALQKLLPCYKADPNNVETLTLLGQTFDALGQTTKLLAVYRELASVYAQSGATEEALAAWRRVAALDPEDPEAAAAVGMPPGAEAPRGRAAAPPPFATEEDLGSAEVLVPPVQPPTANGRADAGMAVPADATTEKVSTTGPTTAAPATTAPPRATPSPALADATSEESERILGEADVYLKYGLHEKALEHLQRILAVDPDHIDAREKAAKVRELRKDIPGAVEEMLLAIRGALTRGLGDRARLALDRLRVLAPDHAAIAELEAVAGAQAELGAADARDDGDADGVLLELDDLSLGGDAPAAAADQPLVRDGDDLALSAVVEAGDDLVEGSRAAAADDGPRADTGPHARGLEPVPIASEALPADAPLHDELAEVDFFVAQGLLADARALLEDLAAAHPAHAGVAARIRKVESDPAESGPSPSTPAPAPQDRVRRSRLVEESQTHYDLGLAYREMGLLDDALQELETALAGARGARRIDCLTMIGLCRLESSDAKGAVAAYRDALEANGLADDLRRAVEYQIAAAYESAGDADAALFYLNRVVASDPGYRDARASVARLGGGPGRAPEPSGAAHPDVA